MLRLVGGPSVSTLPPILFEHNYPYYKRQYGIHTHAATCVFNCLRAVTTPSVMASSTLR